MDIPTLTTFLMWCTILNGGLLMLWTIAIYAMPDLVYRMHKKWFPMSREIWGVVIYCFLGGFKVVFIIFNLVPLVALLIMKGGQP